jgi:hypothetical protein
MLHKSQVIILNGSKTENSQVTSFLLQGFPKVLVGEIAKHRLIAMSCQSSRAMTVGSTIQQIKNDPYLPIWTKNQKGMNGLRLTGFRKKFADILSIFLSRIVILFVQVLSLTTKTHKQNLNRFLEPWMKVSLILTATEWENFFNLRCADDAQDDLREFAIMMRNKLTDHTPNDLKDGEWHKPYPWLSLEENVAKVASVSYSNHAKDRTITDSMRLFNQLKDSKHWVPFEHCLMAVDPGQILKNSIFEAGMRSYISGIQVFDIFQPELSCLAWQIEDYVIINTGSFKGFMPLRRFIENDISTGIYDTDYHLNYGEIMLEKRE